MSDLKREDQINQETSDNPRLCSVCCQFFGTKVTEYLCSKCFKEKHGAATQLTSSITNNEAAVSFSPKKSSFDNITESKTAIKLEEVSQIKTEEPEKPKPKAEATAPSKCASCSKKVGVMGFVCRCGSTFCRNHRLPEDHDCEFDFKQLGRDKIAQDNQKVVASKLDAI